MKDWILDLVFLGLLLTFLALALWSSVNLYVDDYYRIHRLWPWIV